MKHRRQIYQKAATLDRCVAAGRPGQYRLADGEILLGRVQQAVVADRRQTLQQGNDMIRRNLVRLIGQTVIWRVETHRFGE